MYKKLKELMKNSDKVLFSQDFYPLQLFQLLTCHYKNQVSMVIPLFISFTDTFKNKIKEANNNLNKYKTFMTGFYSSHINSYCKSKRKQPD